jgi:hypothetical protein
LNTGRLDRHTGPSWSGKRKHREEERRVSPSLGKEMVDRKELRKRIDLETTPFSAEGAGQLGAERRGDGIEIRRGRVGGSTRVGRRRGQRRMEGSRHCVRDWRRLGGGGDPMRTESGRSG